MRLKGKNCYKVIKWEKLAANDTRVTFLKKNTSRGCLLLPQGYIHVLEYMTIIFKHLFLLKSLCESKPNFMWSLLEFCKNGLGHMAKMTVMPIYEGHPISSNNDLTKQNPFL